MRYSIIFARCADDAFRLHVDASSLSSGAPHRSSTQSFKLYAISRSAARSSTSFSVSVQAEPSLRVYENVARRKPRCENRDQRCPDNQQQGCHSKRQLTHEKQLSPRPSKLVLLNHGKN